MKGKAGLARIDAAFGSGDVCRGAAAIALPAGTGKSDIVLDIVERRGSGEAVFILVLGSHSALARRQARG
jgi:hypothetical protein